MVLCISLSLSISVYVYISSARQSRVPATVRASKQGGVWDCLQSSISLKIQPPKTVKKWSNFWMKSLPKCSKMEASWGSGHLPGGFWRALGGFWVVLGSKRPLGCSVGSSRAALGQLKSHLGVQDGPKLRAKTAQKFCQDGPRCL